MDNLILQGELFPEDSQYHSDYIIKGKLSAVARKASAETKNPRRAARGLLGKRFGKLTVVEITDEVFYRAQVLVCRCDCGKEIKAVKIHLTRKDNPLDNCGCIPYGKAKLSKPGTRGIRAREHTRNNPLVAFKTLYSNYRNSAAKRGYQWHLSASELMQLTQRSCYYCGSEPSQVYKVPPHEFLYNGVDRIDNEKPYTNDNCVPCCGPCNYAKGIRSRDEFMEWVKRVYDFNNMCK